MPWSVLAGLTANVSSLLETARCRVRQRVVVKQSGFVLSNLLDNVSCVANSWLTGGESGQQAENNGRSCLEKEKVELNEKLKIFEEL